jgi:protein-S-isoprenylcysteine O-methyltransferase Ste14
MSRTSAALGSVLFFLVAPCVVAGLIPWAITHWEMQRASLPPYLLWAPGVLLVFAGSGGLIDSFVRFALQGFGTPAPIAPPDRLVITGLYRHVRNPMYVNILAAILGQALLLADWRLVGYGAGLWLAFHVFVTGYEEPRLEKTFGAQYRAFRAGVPRWIPRFTPWRGTP